MGTGCGSCLILLIIVCVILVAIGVPSDAVLPLGFILTIGILVGIIINESNKQKKDTNEELEMKEPSEQKSTFNYSEKTNVNSNIKKNNAYYQDVSSQEWQQKKDSLVEENRLRAEQLRSKYSHKKPILNYSEKSNVNSNIQKNNANYQDVSPQEWQQKKDSLVEENRLRAEQLRLKYSDYIKKKIGNIIWKRVEDHELRSVEVNDFAEIQINATKQQIYSSEKIFSRQPVQSMKEPYATFENMRKVGRPSPSYGYYYGDSAETFYKQAEYMKNFVDDYNKIIPLDTYRTTYEQMTDEQLRTYFTWRKKVRQGNVEDTSLSYAFCYIYELINDIGVSNAIDGLDKLISFWVEFRVYNTKIDSYLQAWIKDYYVTHHSKFSDSFKIITERFPIPYKIHIYIDKLKQGCWDINFVEKHSKHRITSLSFYKKSDSKIIEACLSKVLQELSNLFAEHNLNFIDLFMTISQNQYYRPFSNAVYLSRNSDNALVKLNDHEMYICKNGQWSAQECTFWDFPITKGYILKLIEIQMRKAFGGTQNLKTPCISEIKYEFTDYNHTFRKTEGWKKQAYKLIKSIEFEQTIVNAIQNYCKTANLAIKDGKITKVKPIKIDMSKLEKIQEEHEETAKKLIINEPELIMEESESVHNDFIESNPEFVGISGLANSLSSEETELLNALLNTGQAPTNCELLIESINSKALSIIEDNIIDYTDGEPYVYEEYLYDLKMSIGGNQ